MPKAIASRAVAIIPVIVASDNVTAEQGMVYFFLGGWIYIYIYIYVYIYRFTQLTLARHALSDIFIYTYTYVYRYTKTSTRRCLLPDNRVKSRYCIARGAPLAFSAGHDTTTAAAHGVYSLSVPGGGCIGTTETLCCASLARCAQRAQRKA